MTKETSLPSSLSAKTFIEKNHRVIFYLSWLLIGLIQSRFTELLDDEAYYWVYSRYLDWGYFDHPPMIALLIKMGYAIFPNELGVRLFPLLLNVLSMVIIENLISKKNPFLFYVIALSMAVIQVAGFVAVPDIPLIFFTALFFWCYRRFAASLSFLNTLLLGISIALLFYSKYHALLIVLFTLFSNVKLFKKYQAYLAALIALLLFAPHLWWQYQHDWVSFRYHLFENNVETYYTPSFTIEYILGQLLLPGPVAGFILLPAAFLYKPQNETEKALRYSMIGIYAFFLITSFRGRVEGNWTCPVLVSVIILSHRFLNDALTARAYKWQRLLYKLLPITLVLVVVARVVMMVDILPLHFIRERNFSWKTWPAEMKERTKGLPVVFSSSYQRASKYWFYTGQITYSQNAYKDRRNNFNFWPVEDSLLGKPVYFLDVYRMRRFPDSLKTPIGWVGYKYDPVFTSFDKINFIVSPATIKARPGEEITLHCKMEVPPLFENFIRTHTALADTTIIGFFNSNGWQQDIVTTLSLKQLIDKKEFELKIHPSLGKGKYYFVFAIQSGNENATHNSDKITLTIE